MRYRRWQWKEKFMNTNRWFESGNEGGIVMEESRLEAFEKMLASVQSEYDDILAKMEKMKVDGKVKTVTYQQMMSRKMMYQNMISLYQLYGLVEKVS